MSNNTPTGATITSGQGTNSVTVSFDISLTASGRLSVTAQNACGTSAPRNLTISLNTPVAAPGTITGPIDGLCGATNVPYSVPIVAGVTYDWTLPVGATVTGVDVSAEMMRYALRHEAAGPLDHLLCALLGITAGASRHVLPVAGHSPGATLGRFSEALEASLVHGFSSLMRTHPARCHFYAIGRARRARPVSSSGARDCGCAKNVAIGSPRRCSRSRILRMWKSSG